MKVEALEVSFREDGVHVFVRTRVEVPLRRLFECSMSALESVRLDPGALGAPDACLDGRRPLELAPMRLQGMSAAHQGLDGLVVARTVAQAMSFLLDRWVPEGDGQPDATIRQVRAHRGTRHKRLAELEELLLKSEEEEMDFNPRRSRRRRRLQRARFVWKLEDFQQAFQAVRSGRKRVYLPCVESHFGGSDLPLPSVVLESSRRVGSHEVPQWDVLSVRTHEGVVMARGCVNGRWFQGPLSRLDARVTEAFEERGRLINLLNGDPLAGEALEARFLVRVPRGAGPALGQVGAAPGAAAAHPAAILVDCRCPVTLPPDLPVIDDPAEAWAVLLRTSAGVFMPDAPPATAPRAFGVLGGGYVVGCVPAPLVRVGRP